MAWNGSGKWTVISPNAILIITSLEFCHPTKFVQYLHSSFKSRLRVSRRHLPPGSEVTAYLTQECFYLSRGHVLAQYFHQFVKDGPIWFWKELLGFWCQVVEVGRLATATTHTPLLHKPISLERSQMSTDGIVSQTKSLGQFIDGAAGTTKQRDDATPSTGKKLLVPLHRD
jgi:hypothetical protein